MRSGRTAEITAVAKLMMTTAHPTAALRQAAEILDQAKNIFVLSGAGLSKASGIPTYRDAGGLYEKSENMQYSTIEAYHRDPSAFLKYWSDRRREIGPVRPNKGHIALRDLQKLKPTTVIATQNVDGLLSEAGCTDVLEMHGSMCQVQCDRCGTSPATAFLGRCVQCFARVRPAVVLFGESLSPTTLRVANFSARHCDVILVVGTSAVVDPVAELPTMALKAGARMVVLNIEENVLSRAADVFLQGPAETLLPELIDRAKIIAGSRVLLADSSIQALSRHTQQ